MTSACDIYQAHLDKVSRLLWDGDAESVANMLYYPHVIHLPEADRVISNPAEQSKDAEAFRESLSALGATAFHRLCREARFDPDTPDRIIGVHTTYVMHGGSYLTDPYDCAMSLLKQTDGRWLADAIRVSVRNSGMAYYHRDNIFNRPKNQTSND
ncbi:hypothetical protein SAMN05444004_10478 [Jannaschia faecimaris]|uniref:SnoaL-like domain-containing protein n=1 Tax=Jannaschia faecimaris TaxID=1244108 RepID=A0A1H3NTA0_9RHOB|nr:hypothetical protein [Jannaschia faecimaris]SDY91399.1 hypothetical protein SAMN05444004_10478 [Jannaschia faecimaris]